MPNGDPVKIAERYGQAKSLIIITIIIIIIFIGIIIIMNPFFLDFLY